MAIVDDVRQALKSLKDFPSKQLIERADSEGDSPLESGRSLHETIDFAEELIETTGTLLKEGKIELLPAPLAKQIRASLTNVTNHAQRVAQGNAQPQELENQVEALHVRLWAPGLLHDLDELPGLQAKNKKLESLKRKGRRIVRELEGGTPLVAKLREDLSQLQDQVGKAAEELAEIEAKRIAATKAAEEAAANSTKTEQTRDRAKRIEEEITELRSSAKASDDEVGAVKEKVKLFFQEIEKNETQLEELFGNAETKLNDNRNATQELIERLKELEEQIELQLQKATGASLFHAFHARRKSISIAKWVWAVFSVGSLVFSVWWGVFLAGQAETLDAIFWVKLGATLPLLAVVVFCLSQYGRERRAEEQYAFKSALSLSLVPYKELIEGVEGADLSPEYAKFLVSTIDQIYKPPSGAGEGGKESENYVSLQGIKALTNLVEKVVNR